MKHIKKQLFKNLLSLGSCMIPLTAHLGCVKNIKQPSEHLKTLAYGHIVARAIHQIAYFKVADEIDGQTTTANIADKLGLNADSLHRVLNVLINHGIFARTEQGLIEHTSLSNPLRSAANPSLRAALAKENDNRRWEAMGRLDIALTKGISPFHELYGEGFYDYLEKNPAASLLFNTGMNGFSIKEDIAIAHEYNFTPFKKIIDIGGGNGGLLTALLKKYPTTEATLFDLKDAVEKSPILINHEFKDRIHGVVGDFFNNIPVGHDLYILKRVLHNWDDENSLKILKNCRKTINNSSQRLLVIEKILPKIPDGSLLVDTDMIALAFGDGRERTIDEFNTLLEKAGFIIQAIQETSAGVGIMVLAPKDLI